MAIVRFYEDILFNLDNNKAVCAIFLDLSKAFDSVNKNILLGKLYRCGIRGNTHDLINSYLSNRKQFIQINDIKSESCSTMIGVPQGSCLSPLLFLILINDIQNYTNLKVINFADDTLLYHKIDDPNNFEILLNSEFHKVISWLNINHLKLNTSKTNYMIFSPKSPKFKELNNITLKSGKNTIINKVTHCKYLGMIIDDKLNWNQHISNLSIKLAKIVGILYKIRYYVNKTSLVLILHSLLISSIKYGIMCYGRANQTNLKPIKVLFNRALRCINFLKRRDKRTSQIYFDHGLLNFDDMFKLELGKFCYKFNNNLLPKSFDSFLTYIPSIHSHNTRNSINNYYINRQIKNTGCTTINYLGPKLWRNIPFHVKSQKSVFLFSYSYKRHMLNSYIQQE